MKFIVISLCLIVGAIISDIAAKGYFSRSTAAMARLASEQKNASEADGIQSQTKPEELRKTGEVFMFASWGLAIAGVLLRVVCEYRKEKRWRLLFAGLFIFWCMLQLAIV